MRAKFYRSRFDFVHFKTVLVHVKKNLVKGPSCSETLCPKNCMGRGLCVDGECECGSNNEGLQYGGPACEKLLCDDDCNES